MTVIQTMWWLGRSLTRGIGCLGGTCGACPISIRFPHRFDVKMTLACQTPVAEGMILTFLQPDTAKREITSLPTGSLTGNELLQHYPEIRRCTACQACSSACPQGINTMVAVREAVNGDYAAVAERFDACVMCGLCAVVCGSGIQPQRVGMYLRRLQGAFYPKKATQLLERIDEIASGKFNKEWENVMQSNDTQFQEDVVQEEILK